MLTKYHFAAETRAAAELRRWFSPKTVTFPVQLVLMFGFGVLTDQHVSLLSALARTCWQAIAVAVKPLLLLGSGPSDLLETRPFFLLHARAEVCSKVVTIRSQLMQLQRRWISPKTVTFPFSRSDRSLLKSHHSGIQPLPLLGFTTVAAAPPWHA